MIPITHHDNQCHPYLRRGSARHCLPSWRGEVESSHCSQTHRRSYFAHATSAWGLSPTSWQPYCLGRQRFYWRGSVDRQSDWKSTSWDRWGSQSKRSLVIRRNRVSYSIQASINPWDISIEKLSHYLVSLLSYLVFLENCILAEVFLSWGRSP